jgi:hypothetical protein
MTQTASVGGHAARSLSATLLNLSVDTPFSRSQAGFDEDTVTSDVVEKIRISYSRIVLPREWWSGGEPPCSCYCSSFSQSVFIAGQKVRLEPGR